MKTGAKVAITIVALLAFAVSFFGATVGLDITQPNAKSAQVVHFIINPQDNTNSIAARLQKLGLIRNATIFREYAKYKGLDRKLEFGSYDLRYNMTMDQLITTLLHGVPGIVDVCIPPGLRLTEYPTYFTDHNLDGPTGSCKSTDVPQFDPTAFLAAAKSGVLPSGDKASDIFWYVMPPQKNVVYPLEGYLFADTYQMDTTWDTTAVFRHLIATWGVELCPGPSSNIYQYIHDPVQCKAHPQMIKVGSQNVSIFKLLEQQFFTKDDRLAFYDALTLSSIVVREAGQNPKDIPAVASVYYNRFYVMAKLQNLAPSGDTIVSFDADPTVWYANDTDNPPANGLWWKDPQKGPGKTVDPNNPYNTYTHNGLPPGPISTPRWEDMLNVLLAPVPTATSPFYFYHDNCGTIHLASTQAQQDSNIQKYQNAKCS
jgi:UPF0755 protein